MIATSACAMNSWRAHVAAVLLVLLLLRSLLRGELGALRLPLFAELEHKLPRVLPVVQDQEHVLVRVEVQGVPTAASEVDAYNLYTW